MKLPRGRPDRPLLAPVLPPTPGGAVPLSGDRRAPRDDDSVPYGVRVAAAWSWRLLLIVVGVFALVWCLSQVATVVVPVLIALLLAALGHPLVRWLSARGVHRGLASLITVLLGIGVVAGLLTFVTRQVVSGLPDLQQQFSASIDQLQNTLHSLGISQDQLQTGIDELRKGFLGGGRASIGHSVLMATTTAADVLAGLLIVLFSTFFLLYDGDTIWHWVLRLLPSRTRGRTDVAGRAAWVTLGHYVRATVIVAAVDATGIGLVAFGLRLPLVFPIAAIVFLGSFIPIVGAFVSGIVAVAVAFVTHGPWAALIMLGGILAVQQIEAHVLQPFLLGRFVRIHPLAIVLTIAVGSYLAGIVGALVAVPTAAVINSFVTALSAANGNGESEALEVAEQDRQADVEARREHERVAHDGEAEPPTPEEREAQAAAEARAERERAAAEDR